MGVRAGRAHGSPQARLRSSRRRPALVTATPPAAARRLDAFTWQLWVAVVLTMLGVGALVWGVELATWNIEAGMEPFREYMWYAFGFPLFVSDGPTEFCWAWAGSGWPLASVAGWPLASAPARACTARMAAR